MGTQILVTTDYSPEAQVAFRYAEQQAIHASADAQITVLSILEDLIPVSVQFEFGFSYIDSPTVHEEIAAQAREKLSKLVDSEFQQARARGVSVKGDLVRATRPVSLEITEYAKAGQYDLIVMSTHGRSGLGHFFLGSVAERVIRESTCPVFVVPARHLKT